jgi:hypothetical protein
MAVTSKTDICNLASDLLSGSTIQDIDNPTTANESLFERWYDQCRKKVLREHPWNFAAKRATVAASSVAPAFGYTVAFSLPNDFIRLLTVENSDGTQYNTADFQVESHEGVKSILLSTDATILYIRYIYDIETVTNFDPMFIQYLAYDIALAVAFKMTESNSDVARVEGLQKQQGAMARAISGQERPPTRVQRSKNRQARMEGSAKVSHRILFS